MVYKVSGFIAGSIAAFITTPIDVIKTLYQVEKGPSSHHSSLSVLRDVVSRHGYKALMRGWQARISWIAPNNALTIVLCKEQFCFILSRLHSFRFVVAIQCIRASREIATLWIPFSIFFLFYFWFCFLIWTDEAFKRLFGMGFVNFFCSLYSFLMLPQLSFFSFLSLSVLVWMWDVCVVIIVSFPRSSFFSLSACWSLCRWVCNHIKFANWNRIWILFPLCVTMKSSNANDASFVEETGPSVTNL